jgi:hypothetical protein
VLLGEYTFVATGDVTALYAANQRLYVGITVPKIPSPLATGEIIGIDIGDPQFMAMIGTPVVVAGIPNAIVGVDDGDSLLAVADHYRKRQVLPKALHKVSNGAMECWWRRRV